MCILNFLGEYSEALMVLITAIYVIATIAICRANIQSAKATQEQLIESRKQFEETKRLQVMPYLQLDFVEQEAVEVVPCLFVEMRTDKHDSCDAIQAYFTLKNIGAGIAHHTRITVTTRYKKDDGYPAHDIVLPPNCTKSTNVKVNIVKYEGELGRREDILIKIKFEDVLGNAYIQTAELVIFVQAAGAHLLSTINMKSPEYISHNGEAANV